MSAAEVRAATEGLAREVDGTEWLALQAGHMEEPDRVELFASVRAGAC
ncbi:hypothetical protein QQY66_15945 [Streptomyces sp. DG2A-72]|nr:hypothetical protein [Streptomyces sp. DG2A-72]MDO0933111.1 hypothetical protein [Streptomyces sp. DG2A-72]